MPPRITKRLGEVWLVAEMSVLLGDVSAASHFTATDDAEGVNVLDIKQ